jgi:hypothetical protein
MECLSLLSDPQHVRPRSSDPDEANPEMAEPMEELDRLDLLKQFVGGFALSPLLPSLSVSVLFLMCPWKTVSKVFRFVADCRMQRNATDTWLDVVFALRVVQHRPLVVGNRPLRM